MSSTFKWGTVTATSPLRVRLDGDTLALPFTPDYLVDPMTLAVNDRVRCELSSRRVVVVGRSGGIADTGWINLGVAGGLTGSASYRVVGRLVEIRLDVSGSIGSDTALTGTLPSGYWPTGQFPTAQGLGDPFPARSTATLYVSPGGQVRVAPGEVQTRMRGSIIYHYG